MKAILDTHRHHSGFTLIEVLAAVTILSIGLLGIAGLQAVAKKANSDAIQRTTATMLAYDIIERMRANNDHLDDYLISNDAPFTTTNAVASSSIIGDVSNATCTRSAGDTSTTCAITVDNTGTTTRDDVAAADLNSWRNAIIGATETLSINGTTTNTGGLVQPSACITSTTDGTGAITVYTVSIAWRGKNALSNPTASTCGANTGLYDKNAGDNAYRRLLTMNFYTK